MDLAMNFDADECLVTAMFDKGNRNDTMEAIDNIIPFLKGDADMIGLVCTHQLIFPGIIFITILQIKSDSFDSMHPFRWDTLIYFNGFF